MSGSGKAIGAFLVCVVAAGCSNGPTEAPPSTRTSATSAPETGVGHLDCNVIGTNRPPAGYRVVGDAVAVPAATVDGAPIPATRDDAERDRPYFARSGLIVRVDRGWAIGVPTTVRDRLALDWGSPGVPGEELRPPTCTPPRSPTGWSVYPGGFRVSRPGCYPVEVRTKVDVTIVHVAIGKPCP